VVTMTVVRFGCGYGEACGGTQQVQGFLWALNHLYVLWWPVARHPRAWVRREGSLLQQQHGEAVLEHLLHLFDADAPPLRLPRLFPSAAVLRSLFMRVLWWRCRVEFFVVPLGLCLFLLSYSSLCNQHLCILAG
jgi:hypothetical protein